METAITVTGLKAGHFYNVRVIAVGSNNFQAGSRVIRLRTYGRDGRPQLGSGRSPSSISIEDQESSDDLPSVRTQSAGIETAAVSEGAPVLQRESSNQTGQRRNTGGRKHSSSNAAADDAANGSPKPPEESLQQLTERFEGIRKETEDLMTQMTKEAEDFRTQFKELTKERNEKKQMLKEKEEASERLKRDVNNSERANRQAQTRKTQKEKVLRDKEADRAKMQDDIARWGRESEDMKTQRNNWLREKEKLLKAKELEAKELQGTIHKRHSSIGGLEEEIRIKGLQIKELEEERKHLPGGEENEESRAHDSVDRQRDIDWEIKQKNLTDQLNARAMHLRQIEYQQQEAQNTYSALSIRPMNNPLMYQANSSGVDFDPMAGQNKPKPRRSRKGKSRTSTISSPLGGRPITDSQFPSASVYNNFNTSSPSFAPGPYFDLNNDAAMQPLSEHIGMSEADVHALTAGAPLSPTAASLIPSFFADDEPPSPHAGPTSFGGALYGNLGPAMFDEPQSPASSSCSASLISSPRTSSQNLAKYGVSGHDYATENERRSLHSPRAEFGVIGSSVSSSRPSSNKGFANMFFPKSRGKTTSQDGPALGSLKQGQSQSFPRSTDEPEMEPNANRPRRTSLSSSWNVVPFIFSRGQGVSEATEGNGPAPARHPTTRSRRSRAFGMFGGSSDDPTMINDRDPSSPRPVSIASSDLPRPSSESAHFGWPTAEGAAINRNSPLATNWSVNVAQPGPQPWSSNPSRRPSIQHGSTTALTSGIASEDDEFLPSDTLGGQSSPPPVGVIGTRPISSHVSAAAKLNPTAPTFSFLGFSSKSEKAKERVSDKPTSSGDGSKSVNTSSPPESRKSRDTHSIHTQNSMAESHESLEITSSNTPSEMTNQSMKDKESSFRQLLRKGSSSKFSLSSIRGKDSGLFGGKKGGSSIATSERDSSLDGFGDDGQGVARNAESVTSSPMLGSGDWTAKGKENPGTPKEGRMSGWTRAFKKGKARESLDVDRSEAETTGTEDEGS